MATAVARPVEKVDTDCVHCGSPDSELVWSGHEHEYDNTTDEEFRFVRCLGCGVVRLNPRPDVSELGQIYPHNYYAYGLLTEEADAASGLGARLKKWMYQRRLMALLDRLGKEGTVRVLDVGCADGRLLDWYKSSPAGDRLETYGIELSEAAAEQARRRGHEVVTGRFEVDTEFEPGSFDLILAYHVIEHVDDPKAFAQRAADLLRPGGLFVAATPNLDSVDAQRFGGHWGGNHFPRHWTLYDAKTLEGLARDVGLVAERVEYQVNPVFWVWSFHSALKDHFPKARWPDRLFPTIDIFHRSFQSFVLLSVFTTVDLLQRVLTGRTASMAVELRKPA